MDKNTINAFESYIKRMVFVSIGTCNLRARPHNSPKVMVEFHKKSLYLVEYAKKYSFKNISVNHWVSISTFDLERMKGFYIYGKAKIICQGDRGWQSLLKKFERRQVAVCAEEVIAKVQGKERLRLIEFVLMKPVAFYKIHITKIRSIPEKRTDNSSTSQKPL